MSALALAGVVKRYGDRTALDGVDLALAAGEMLALLGPNGAGKSTLVGIASGLLKPDAGSVQVSGRPGLAPQEIGIYPSLTVRENLWAFAEIHGVGRRRAERLLEPFVLTALADRPAGRLSGGEQRRLHTAIALVHRPRVVLLDEPTAGADTQTRAAILDAVRGLAAEGTAVVYTTHYLPEVEALGAGVALLEAGRIIASGTVAELVARHAESVLEVVFTDGRVVRRPGASLHGLEQDVIRAEIIRPSLEAAYLALTGRRSARMSIVRTELRLLRHDPVPAAVLVGMPLVLMTLLSDAMKSTLATEGYPGVAGSAQTVPGMACVFASFAIAVVGFAIFREHGWRTWPRLRAAGLSGRTLLGGKLAVPAGLVAAQHIVLFGFGVAFLDLSVSGSWLAVSLIAATFAALVLTAGLAAAAALSTIQQVNAVTNLGAMVLGGLGGGFVPVESLPDWIEPIAPISPVYWAMDGYRTAILDGGGVADVLAPVGVLVAFTALFAAIALWRLKLDEPKRTWG